MTIFVTGGAGFIGSHLSDYLFEHTSEKLILLDDFSTGREANVSQLLENERVELIHGDIRDEETVEDHVARASTVYHLAAAVGVERVVDDPLKSLRINVDGSGNVIDAAARHGVPTFVASSSEVYGKSPSVPFAETDDRLLGPTTSSRWGYATAKSLDEFLALAHHEESDFPVVIGRFFNIVGPRQSDKYGMVIPKLVGQAINSKPLTVYGDGTQTRSFTHVTDAVETMCQLMESSKSKGEIFNIGASQSVTINELADRIIELTNSESSIEHIPYEEAYGPDFEEPQQRQPDTTKLHSVLGWTPDADIDRIITDVVSDLTE